MVYCSVSNCSNRSDKYYCSSTGITFHRFPKEPDVKEKWILATGKKNWFPPKYSSLCSAHFKDNDFDPTRKRRVLLKHAHPTVDVWVTVDNSSSKKNTSIDEEPVREPSSEEEYLEEEHVIIKQEPQELYQVTTETSYEPPQKRTKKKVTRNMRDKIRESDTVKVVKRTEVVKTKDECDMFGEYIAVSLRKYDERTQAMIKQAVNNILFEQEMKKYSTEYTVVISNVESNPLIVDNTGIEQE